MYLWQQLQHSACVDVGLSQLCTFVRFHFCHVLFHGDHEWTVPLVKISEGGGVTRCFQMDTLFYISLHVSGTYNSQYMVVDLHRVTLGHSIRDGALTVVEQIPGKVVYSDQTQALRRGKKQTFLLVSLCFWVWNSLHLPAGYWPSYNIPFHVEIYNLSGYGAMWKRHGVDFSYDLCPRAKILRRDQAKVSDLNSLKRIMRYNSKYSH